MVESIFFFLNLSRHIQNVARFSNSLIFLRAAQLYLIDMNHGITQDSITVKHKIEHLHKYEVNTPAVCSGLSVHGTNIATIGEDGR